MNQGNTAYGEDGGYHMDMDLSVLMGGGDSYEERGKWGEMAPEAAMLAANTALEVDRAPITADVRTHVVGAGVELGA